MSRTFYEFFAGGGMARIGLGPGWRCLVANDSDPAKCAAYRANFGGEELIERDVAALAAADLPGRADLAWASFPCQDLSLAGARRGMELGARTRSGVFWAFWFLIERLAAEGRAPRAIVIENVVGLASSAGGADFAALCEALAGAGYRFDAHVLDAAAFVPQSRPRLFLTAWRGPAPAALRADAADLAARPKALRRALARLDEGGAAAHLPLRLPAPPPRNVHLEDVIEAAPPRAAWKSRAETAALLRMMTQANLARVEAAQARARDTGRAVAGGLFRRMRPDGRGGTVQRAEVRFDIAGCLRTPAGGSSRQILVIAEPDGRVRMRLFTGRETARLMGLPDDYRLPERATAALELTGDGVAAPAARWIARALVEPLLDAADAARAPAAPAPALAPGRASL